MNAYRIALTLALFTASVSSAQAPEDVPVAGAENPAPLPPLVEAPPEPQSPAQAVPEGESIPYQYRPEAEAPPDPIVPRILAEVAGGVLGGAVMGLAGLLTGAPALRKVNCSSGEVCVLPLVFIMVPAAFAGVPYSVQAFAEGLGGRGDLLPTIGGSVLGTGAGFLTGLLSGSTGGMIASLILGPITGAILGYEISHALNQRRALAAGATPSASSGLRVVPLIGAAPRGGFLGGLEGNF